MVDERNEELGTKFSSASWVLSMAAAERLVMQAEEFPDGRVDATVSARGSDGRVDPEATAVVVRTIPGHGSVVYGRTGEGAALKNMTEAQAATALDLDPDIWWQVEKEIERAARQVIRGREPEPPSASLDAKFAPIADRAAGLTEGRISVDVGQLRNGTVDVQLWVDDGKAGIFGERVRHRTSPAGVVELTGREGAGEYPLRPMNDAEAAAALEIPVESWEQLRADIDRTSAAVVAEGAGERAAAAPEAGAALSSVVQASQSRPATALGTHATTARTTHQAAGPHRPTIER